MFWRKRILVTRKRTEIRDKELMWKKKVFMNKKKNLFWRKSLVATRKRIEIREKVVCEQEKEHILRVCSINCANSIICNNMNSNNAHYINPKLKSAEYWIDTLFTVNQKYSLCIFSMRTNYHLLSTNHWLHSSIKISFRQRANYIEM